MTDEEVIRRRLLVDGDGTGDDRRLNVLLKTMIKWCNTKDTPEESQAVLDKMLAQLSQCEFAVTKSQLASQMTSSELKNYETMSTMIEKDIESVKVHIVKSKQELKIAKTIRKNRMQYDVLAKIINEQPDRKMTQEKLTALKREIEELNMQRKTILENLDTRKKEFNVFVTSMYELLKMLDAADSGEEINVSSDGFEENFELEKTDGGHKENMEVDVMTVDVDAEKV